MFHVILGQNMPLGVASYLMFIQDVYALNLINMLAAPRPRSRRRCRRHIIHTLLSIAPPSLRVARPHIRLVLTRAECEFRCRSQYLSINKQTNARINKHRGERPRRYRDGK